MDLQRFNRELMDFLASSPTPFHAVREMARRLSEAGFQHRPEADAWGLEPNGRYFTTRNDSSLVAWTAPARGVLAERGLRMVGAHTDSPCLKVKPQPELQRHGCLQLAVEVYGGALLNPWFDRDLSLAGRVSYLDRGGVLSHGLVDFARPVAVIPSLAIHLDREANENRTVNAQTCLPPVLGQGGGALEAHEASGRGHAADRAPRQGDRGDLKALLRRRLEEDTGAEVGRVLDYELFLYDTQRPALVGLEEEFLASARLDNLLSCFTGLRALLDAGPGAGALLACHDHEEVGSTTASGARGPMLTQALERLLPDPEERNRALSRSMLVSVDNAHAVHPNFADRYDDNHAPRLNRGPVLKVNANQRYATNSETAALFRRLAEDEGVPVQAFAARSDMPCGSTIGPLAAAETGVRTVDVGAPQWAMHSVRELAGARDAFDLSRVLRRFFDTERL